jgi:hypothetical protein
MDCLSGSLLITGLRSKVFAQQVPRLGSLTNGALCSALCPACAVPKSSSAYVALWHPRFRAWAVNQPTWNRLSAATRTLARFSWGLQHLRNHFIL